MKSIARNQPKFIKVCAWCPNTNYPALSINEEYTHGMCLKHYKQLSLHKQIPLELYISTFLEKTFSKFSINNCTKKLKKLLKPQKRIFYSDRSFN